MILYKWLIAAWLWSFWAGQMLPAQAQAPGPSTRYFVPVLQQKAIEGYRYDPQTGDSARTTLSRYDRSGHMCEAIAFREGEFFFHWVIEGDLHPDTVLSPKGYDVKVIYYNQTGRVPATETRHHDRHHRLISQKKVYQDKSQSGSIIQYRYNKRGQIVALRIRDLSKKPLAVSKITYAYNQQGSCTRERLFAHDGSIRNTDFYAYDSLGNLIAKTTNFGNNPNQPKVTKMMKTYDAQNRLIYSHPLASEHYWVIVWPIGQVF